ncbi:MAG: Mov34/MPN/PAD-1 family protein [Candidatus Limnocylindrales bacterium]
MTLWIGRDLLRRLAREADEAQPDETGGVLLGWRNGDDAVIQQVVDAGPRAQRWPTGMRPDAEYQATKVAAAFEATDGAVTYLGDWHSHPGTTPTPSRRDRKTLRNIATDADAQCPEPLMLIVAGGEPVWEPGAFAGRLGRLGRWGPLSFREVGIRLFDAR